MTNKSIRFFLTFLLFLFPFHYSYSQDDYGTAIEELKQQIEEIQRINEEQLRRIQEESERKIEALLERIDELEMEKAVEEPRMVVDERTLDLKIREAVEDREVRTDSRIKVDFSPDFPSYYRTRVRFLDNATFVGAASSKDEVFFADSRLLLSPRISYDDFISVRAQFDIARNLIWGGMGDELVSDRLFSAPNPRDSFRGAILRDVVNTQSGDILSPTEEIDLVDIRSLYMVAVTDYGVLWAGRQPFDWGLGLLNNAGSMPDQDLGSIVDRINFDTAPFSLIDEKWEKLLFSFIVDRLSEGRSIGTFDQGDGWDVGLAMMYKDTHLEFGAYVFGIFQKNFALSDGITADLDDTINWSAYAIYRYDPFRFSFEFQQLFGKISNISEPLRSAVGERINITGDNISLITRVEYHPPSYFVRSANLEFGFAGGDDASTPDKIEGNTIYFNNAYVIDNLLYKHMIPNIYALEGSVINSYYLRGWSTLRLNDSFYLTPQLLFGWVHERNALAADPFSPLPRVGNFLGTEVEATLTWKIRDHLWFDLIGSLVFSGSGLDDLLSQRAFIEGAVDSINDADPASVPFAVQGRFIITFDSIIDRWTGNSTVMQRAWFGLF